MQENPNWISELAEKFRFHENPGLEMIGDLSLVLTDFPLSLDQIQGDIMIAGGSYMQAERLFVSTPESEFLKLREEINSVTCFEPELFIALETVYDHEIRRLREGVVPQLDHHVVNHSRVNIQRGLKNIDKPIFDVATFFRISDMFKQFPSVLPRIHQALKKNGLFIGSGQFNSLEMVKEMAGELFRVDTVMNLPEQGDFRGFPIMKHIGFILSKI